jgi:hypothetical protein
MGLKAKSFLRLMVSALVGAVVTVMPVAAPAFAAGTGCPSSGCVGQSVDSTNCRNGAYAIASTLVQYQLQVNRMREWMFYSPLCNTYWGLTTTHTGGYPYSMELYAQDEYGGRDTRVFSYFAPFAPDIAYESTMVSAGNSVKMCINGSLESSPDVDPYLYGCTDWR